MGARTISRLTRPNLISNAFPPPVESNPERQRAGTVDEIAAGIAAALNVSGEGRSEEDIRHLIEAKMAELNMKQEDLPDDYFADCPGEVKKAMEGHGGRLEALERKAKVTEALVYEISNDLYKNSIRVVPKPRV